ncbi:MULTISPECIES: ABC transporter permease [Burkholderiales]|uniref:ABC transporter permease n=1 Tax=Burkholderiales TaxID=80840 RepID=UPI00257D63B0|nr:MULTISPECIES: ABC transporter permease [Burkholderiales]MBA4280934.1 ABC transporter permease [Ralstonia sp.]MDO9505896.1 ABC transporter permease [Hydrogenophaga sp.]
MKRWADAAISVALGLGVLLAWEGATRAWAMSALVLPAPSAIARALLRGLETGYWWPHIGQTLVGVALGLAAGALLGFGSGLLLGTQPRLRRWLTPYLLVSQLTPKLALAPLFILWFGFGTWPTVVMTALICFFPLLENTLAALDQTDPQQLELLSALNAGPWQTLWRLQIPAGRHTLAAGLRVALVLAWVGTVVSEFISAGRGLGAVIIGAQGSMDTALLFAALVLIAVLGVASYALLRALEQRWCWPERRFQ